MTQPTVARRFLLCAVALVVSAVVLRPQLSSALVSRGDELSARSNVRHALTLYQRAVWLDSRNGVAIDRVAFTAIMTHDPAAIRASVAQVTAYLNRSPDELPLLFDRAMCERMLGSQRASERDFVKLAQRSRDPQAYTFAGYAALRQAALARARHWWQLALAIERSYYPARHALARRF